jgi:hypothetical protein
MSGVRGLFLGLGLGLLIVAAMIVAYVVLLRR